MSKVRIITDSSTDIPKSTHPALTVLPISIRFGEQEYLDGVNITRAGFYEKLVECDTLPTTSQVPPFAFAQAYEQARRAGEQVVVLTVSDKLSGTYQSAVLAAQEAKEQVYVVDGHSVAIGSGILVAYALKLVEQGRSAREIAGELERVRDRVKVIALLDTLEYLKRGGRISKAVAFAGGLMSIKPVVTVKDGAVELLGKARGSKQGNNMLVQQIQAAGGVDFSMPLLLGYSGLSDTLLQKYIADSSSLWEGNVRELPQTIISGAVGTHVGPGAVAVAFFRK